MHAVAVSVGAVDVLRGKDLGDRPGGDEARVQENTPREAAPGDPEIMDRGQDRPALRLPVPQDVAELLAPEKIQAGKRLIEEEDVPARCV